MRLCVITPVSHLDLATYGSGIHMALTHLVNSNEDYANAYRRFQAKNEYTILDNSAFEMEQQGKGLDPEPVLSAAKQIGADEVIATDVLCDGPATVKATRNFIREYEKFFSEQIRLDQPIPKIMAVPQGKTIEEWIDCYLQLLITPRVDVIGFSKISVPVCFGGPNARQVSGGVTNSRIKLYDYLDQYQLWPFSLNRNTPIHLLGGDNQTGAEFLNIANSQSNFHSQGVSQRKINIRSNDTSAPVWYGANGIAFDPFTGKAPKFIGEKPDLENAKQVTAENIEKNKSLILGNILILSKCMRGSIK